MEKSCIVVAISTYFLVESRIDRAAPTGSKYSIRDFARLYPVSYLVLHQELIIVYSSNNGIRTVLDIRSHCYPTLISNEINALLPYKFREGIVDETIAKCKRSMTERVTH
jgi:hypothetical protein